MNKLTTLFTSPTPEDTTYSTPACANYDRLLKITESLERGDIAQAFWAEHGPYSSVFCGNQQ